MGKLKILIAASGTGGHLFPAVYIAHAIQKLNPEVDILFVGSGRPLEERLIDGNGFRREVVPMVGLKSMSIGAILSVLSATPKALISTFKVFNKFKPDLVLGVGGYASVLPVILASIKGIPSWIHEAEIMPGKASKILAPFATRISLVYEESLKYFSSKKSIVTGHPVREELAQFQRGEVKAHPKNLLVLGGSQGATSIDDALKGLSSRLQNFSIKHQCRRNSLSSLKAAYEKAEVNFELFEFIDTLADFYAWADLIISRAGAGSITELGLVGKPAILVPYPHAQGGHQLYNAQILEKANKAIVVEEGGDFQERLYKAICALSDSESYKRFYTAPFESLSKSAASQIAAGLLSLH